MSAAGWLEMPRTEHAEAILEGHWPSASEAAWTTYAASFKAAARQLGAELAGNQPDIKEMVAPMSGDYIESVMHVLRSREDALWDRYNAYQAIADRAQRAADQLMAAKNLLLDIVMDAETKIAKARAAAAVREADAATRPAAAEIAAIRAELYETEQTIVADAKAEAAATDARAAAEVTDLLGRLPALTPASAAPLSTGTGSSSTVPATPPGIQPVDYNTVQNDGTTRASKKIAPDNSTVKADEGRDSKKLHPAASAPPSVDRPAPSSQSGPGASEPSTAGPAAGSPGSLVGHMMRPISSGGARRRRRGRLCLRVHAVWVISVILGRLLLQRRGVRWLVPTRPTRLVSVLLPVLALLPVGPVRPPVWRAWVVVFRRRRRGWLPARSAARRMGLVQLRTRVTRLRKTLLPGRRKRRRHKQQRRLRRILLP